MDPFYSFLIGFLAGFFTVLWIASIGSKSVPGLNETDVDPPVSSDRRYQVGVERRPSRPSLHRAMSIAQRLASSQSRETLETLAGFRPLYPEGSYPCNTIRRTLGGIALPPSLAESEAAGLALALIDGTPHPLLSWIHLEGISTDLGIAHPATARAGQSDPK